MECFIPRDDLEIISEGSSDDLSPIEIISILVLERLDMSNDRLEGDEKNNRRKSIPLENSSPELEGI